MVQTITLPSADTCDYKKSSAQMEILDALLSAISDKAKLKYELDKCRNVTIKEEQSFFRPQQIKSPNHGRKSYLGRTEKRHYSGYLVALYVVVAGILVCLVFSGTTSPFAQLSDEQSGNRQAHILNWYNKKQYNSTTLPWL